MSIYLEVNPVRRIRLSDILLPFGGELVLVPPSLYSDSDAPAPLPLFSLYLPADLKYNPVFLLSLQNGYTHLGASLLVIKEKYYIEELYIS